MAPKTSTPRPAPASGRSSAPAPIEKRDEDIEVQRQIRRLMLTVSAAIAVFSALTTFGLLFRDVPVMRAAGLLAFPCALAIVAYAVADSACSLLALDGGPLAAGIWPSRAFWASVAAAAALAGMAHLSLNVRNKSDWDALFAQVAANAAPR